MLDIVTLAASSLDDDSNTLLAQAMVELGDEDDSAEPFGEVPVFGALGVWARPHAKSEGGYCEGVLARGLNNSSGAVISMRDTRTAATAAQLGPGETCVGATGPGFESRSFYKDGLIADVIGDDCAVVFDKKNKSYTINCFGLRFEMSESQGFVMSTGKATFQMKDGSIVLDGVCMLGGRQGSPATAAAYAPGPVAGVTGATVPSQKVFISPP